MKYVLVTGAYGGMGKSAVKQLKTAGYYVFALDLKECEREDNVTPIAADLTSEADVINAFNIIKSVTDKLYAIVHFAGVYVLDSLVEISHEKLARAFEINLFGACRVNRIFLPLLKKRSRIVLTTSELAPLSPLPFTGIYAVTKSALDKYAYSLRMELQLLDISVTVVRPGAVKTDMLGVSTSALDRFCSTTTHYSCNAKRFRSVVDKVEARNVPPKKIAALVERILKKRKPRFVYSCNRNPLLLILNVLPKRFQTYVIGRILKS